MAFAWTSTTNLFAALLCLPSILPICWLTRSRSTGALRRGQSLAQPLEADRQPRRRSFDDGAVLVLTVTGLGSAEDVGLGTVGTGTQLHFDVAADALPVLGLDQVLLEATQIGSTGTDHIAAPTIDQPLEVGVARHAALHHPRAVGGAKRDSILPTMSLTVVTSTRFPSKTSCASGIP